MNRVKFSIFMACMCGHLLVSAEPVTANQQERWWRGNLHTHSFWSDGNDFPEMITAWYLDNGYNFLCLSDHNILSRGEKWVPMTRVDEKSRMDAFPKYLARFGKNWVQTREGENPGEVEVRLKPLDEYRALFEEANNFILIEGEEITDKAGNGLSIHMNAVNLAELVPPPGGNTVQEVIRNALSLVKEQSERLERPILFHVNHLNYKWSVTAEDLAAVLKNQFFEVWNGIESDDDPGDGLRPSSDEIWDIANTLRLVNFGAPPLFAVATDDSHDYHGHSSRGRPGRAWVMVWSRFLTPESIIRAMERGNFYASTGVLLDGISFDGKTLRVKIAAEEGVNYSTRFVGSRKDVNVTGVSRRDSEGNVILTTLDYTSVGKARIGEVFAEVPGIEATYTLSGDELYVRAIISSDAEPDVPSSEYPYKRAWTQPVGWVQGQLLETGHEF